MNHTIKRNEIYYADLSPVQGSEQDGIRPVLIIQNDIGNKHSVDIAGLVKGASKGEGLGNKFLSHIREVDAIIHVVRCFNDNNIIHVDGSVDPLRDLETINLELIFSDIELIERRIDRTKKLMKGDKSKEAEVKLLERIHDELENGISARAIPLTEDERELVADMPLLSAKPVIYAANISEDDVADGGESCEMFLNLKAYPQVVFNFMQIKTV